MDRKKKLEQDFDEKVREIIAEIEKHKLPLRAKICLWLLKRKVKRVV